MPTLTELHDQRGRLVTQAREALTEITANTDESRAAELSTRHDAIMAEFDVLDANIAREERVAEMESRQEERMRNRRPTPPDAAASGSDTPDADYRSAFTNMLLAGGQLGDLSSEERSILRAGAVRAGEVRTQTAGTTTAGGFTVPTTLANFIVMSMAAYGPMYDDNLCTTIATTSGESIKIPTIDDTATAVAKNVEGTPPTDDGGVDVVVGQKSLDAFTFDSEFIRWSIQLMQDSPFNWESILGDLIGQRLGRRANTELTTGDGTGDPNGIVTASSLGKTAAATTAITVDELIDLQHSVDPAYRASPKARFMLNDGTLAKIRKLKDGDGSYIWQMGNIQTGVPGVLLGSPYSVNQAMPASTTGLKAVVYGDFGKYFVRKVGGPMIWVLRERFVPDLGILGLVRFDGELADTAAVKHLIMA